MNLEHSLISLIIGDSLNIKMSNHIKDKEYDAIIYVHIHKVEVRDIDSIENLK